MSLGPSSMNGSTLTLTLVGALAVGAALGKRGSRATDPTFRVRSPAEGHQLIASKVYTDNWKKALAVTPTHREAVLVPCAGTKPFSSAPSHAHGYVPGLEGRAVDRYVVAEPLGIVPWAWEDTYPNNAYDFPPDQLRGKGRDLLVERIRAWFTEGPGRSYDRIWLALPGHHGRLVADATRDLSLPTEDVSITACRAAKACGTSVHRATSKAYVRYLKKTVVPGGARGSRDTDPTSSPGGSTNRAPAPTDAALRTLRAAMVKAARADTAYAPATWKRAKDPLTGHCYGAAHLVQDRFGGEIVKGTVRGQAHAWNRLPGGREVDLTGSQYGGDGLHPLVKGEGVAASRSTNPRFARFAARVDAQLGRR